MGSPALSPYSSFITGSLMLILAFYGKDHGEIEPVARSSFMEVKFTLNFLNFF